MQTEMVAILRELPVVLISTLHFVESLFIGLLHHCVYAAGTEDEADKYMLKKRSVLPVDYKTALKGKYVDTGANGSAVVKNRDSRIYGGNSGMGGRCERQVVEAGTDKEGEGSASQRGTPTRDTESIEAFGNIILKRLFHALILVYNYKTIIYYFDCFIRSSCSN